MSVLKNWDIDLLHSEKRSLYRFLALYIVFTLIIMGFMSNLYIMLQKETIAKQNAITLNDYTNELISKLKEFHEDVALTHPQFDTSLYDSDLNLLVSTLKTPIKRLEQISYTEDMMIRYLQNPQEYYLNTKYLVIQLKQNNNWVEESLKQILLYGSLFFIFMIIVGYFLLNLFLKPMRDAMYLLDRFIKDTTHELNTPVSTIMTNIELIDRSTLNQRLEKLIGRIELGAKSVSNIYNDLTYLVLNNKIASDNQEVDIAKVIEERILYFESLAHIKKIGITTDLKPNITLFIDRNKLSKVIDNLLSNAIKYNKIGGSIDITLTNNQLCIKDSGRGIEERHLSELFSRYTRFDKSVGGFGIGLNIVKLICDEYHISISFDSKITIGTEVTLSW